MHRFAAARLLRLCFVLLFGTMSVVHFPVMAFGHDAHASAAPMSHPQHHHHHHAGHSDPTGMAGIPGKIADRTAGTCDGFACFLAVEALAVRESPLCAVLLGVINVTAADFQLGTASRPDLPPPRIQS